MKKVLTSILLILGLFLLTGCSNKETNTTTILATNFPCYDFLRAITKNSKNIEVKMLLNPGSETHDYEPSPQDVKNIRNSNLFLYVGGESDEWVNSITKDIDINKTKLVKLLDLVDLVEEEITPGMESEEDEEETEYDEHVWTSPKNAIKIINYLKDEIIKIDVSNKELYENNSENYVHELEEIDSNIKDVVKSAKRKELIFGDRFPLRYFVDEYKLQYYAAFPGCSEQTEASAKTISYLIKKVKQDRVPVVLKIELSSGKIANQIAQETNTKVLEFSAIHNISKEDFDAGITYVDIMKKNIEVLKVALN